MRDADMSAPSEALTPDELYDHLASLGEDESWSWVFAQPAEVQASVLRLQLTLGGESLGLSKAAAWVLAMHLVPDGEDLGLGRGDPATAWAAAVDRLRATEGGLPALAVDTYNGTVGEVSQTLGASGCKDSTGCVVLFQAI